MKETKDQPKKARTPHRVRLPGFVVDEDIGLGDMIKQATSSIGIRPCGDCTKRAAVMNSWIVFSGRQRTR